MPFFAAVSPEGFDIFTSYLRKNCFVENSRGLTAPGVRRETLRELLAPGYLLGPGYLLLVMACSIACAAEPPTINPFGPAPAERESRRDDAVPGCIELSDGSLHAGLIYLTRDKRLKIYDEKLERQREISASGGEADRLCGKKGMDGTGVEVQGNHQRREDVHRP